MPPWLVGGLLGVQALAGSPASGASPGSPADDTRWLERPQDPAVLAWAEERGEALDAWLDEASVTRAEGWLQRERARGRTRVYRLLAYRESLRLWQSWRVEDPDAPPDERRYLHELHVQRPGEALPGRILEHPEFDAFGPICGWTLSPDGARVAWGRRDPATQDVPDRRAARRRAQRAPCHLVVDDLTNGTQVAWEPGAARAVDFGGAGHEDTLLVAERVLGGTVLRRHAVDGAVLDTLWRGPGRGQAGVLPDGRETLWRWRRGRRTPMRLATLTPDGPVDLDLPRGSYAYVGQDDAQGLWLHTDHPRRGGERLRRVVVVGETPGDPSTWVEHHVDEETVRWTAVRLQGDTLVAVEDRDGAAHLVEIDVADGTRHEPMDTAFLWATLRSSREGVLLLEAMRADGRRSTWVREESGDYGLLRDDAPQGRSLVTLTTEAPSADGTPIPLSVVHQPGVTPDGDRAAWIHVYGGFGVGSRASAPSTQRPWLEAGGIVVTVHARGGDERGDAWHDAAKKEHLARTFEDVEAAADWLVDAGWSRPERIAVGGMSNGGLTAMACVGRHPEKFGAAFSVAGVHDLVEARRYGHWWPWEYGRPRHPVQGPVLRANSPLHAAPTAPLPPVLVVTGSDDPTVTPSHAYKLVDAWSRLPGGPVHLDRWSYPSHAHHYGRRKRAAVDEAMDEDEAIRDQARIVAFLAQAVGLELPAPPAVPDAEAQAPPSP